ncbi:MAG: cysteine desulfurase [Burkholderiaceae bacterium]|nr:cysteine desulfurase [Burkholderiaceae bacterium]
MTSSTSLPALGHEPQSPLDTQLLAQLATAIFRDRADAPALAQHPVGAQPPHNPAPAGSPLASAAGFSPNVPGTPIPLGQIPGSNVLPSNPAQVLTLGHRAPAGLPKAQAGNGVPDLAFAALPGYEPRLSGLTAAAPVASAAPAAAFADPAAHASTAPQFYFVDAVRLPSGFVTPPKDHPLGAHAQPLPTQQDRHPGFDVHAVRRDFPILSERIHGKQLIWLDNAATTHKPRQVIERIKYFYEHENSNIHRAAHVLAARATDAYEHAREVVRRFINAPDVNEVIFVRGTTEAINLVAKSWGGKHVGEGDEIIVSHLEHHANIVPWQQLAEARGAKLRVIPVDDEGQILLGEYRKLINDRTKIVAIGHVSNTLGTVVPVKEVVQIARQHGIVTLVDGAQSIAHTPVDVQDIGADFFVFSGHKIFAPTGIGVLWGRRSVLEDMPPWQGGGNMIADVTFEKTVFQPLPNTFEAGTGNIADAVGLGAALEYVERLGIENISRYEHALVDYGMQQLGQIPGLRLIGTVPGKASVLSFTLEGYTTDEVGKALNAEGIAVRTGHHCAQPILRRFGVETTVRPSLAFYNTFEEIDELVRVVRRLAGQRR